MTGWKNKSAQMSNNHSIAERGKKTKQFLNILKTKIDLINPDNWLRASLRENPVDIECSWSSMKLWFHIMKAKCIQLCFHSSLQSHFTMKSFNSVVFPPLWYQTGRTCRLQSRHTSWSASQHRQVTYCQVGGTKVNLATSPPPAADSRHAPAKHTSGEYDEYGMNE